MSNKATFIGTLNLALKGTTSIIGGGGTLVRKLGDEALSTKFGQALNSDSYGQLVKGEGQSQEIMYNGLKDLVATRTEESEDKESKALDEAFEVKPESK